MSRARTLWSTGVAGAFDGVDVGLRVRFSEELRPRRCEGPDAEGASGAELAGGLGGGREGRALAHVGGVGGLDRLGAEPRVEPGQAHGGSPLGWLLVGTPAVAVG